MERGDKRSIVHRSERWIGLRNAAVAFACLASSASAQDSDPSSWTNALERLQSLSPVYSETRHFVAIGPDARLKLDAVTWAEEVATRLEEMLGLPLCFQFREFRLVLRKDETRTNGWVSASEGLSGAWLIQRLVIANYEAADMEAVMKQLCQLLVAGQTYASTNELHGVSPWSPASLRRAAPVPRWLACGIAQNIYPSQRARNARMVLNAWQAGRSLPARAILATTNAPLPEAAPDLDTEAAFGVFYAWLQSVPKHNDLMAAMLGRLRNGEAITTEWLTPYLLDGSGTETLNDGWDRWILQLQRTVFDPGETTPEALAQLRAELLLYPGLSGIPKSDRSGQVFGLDYLIAERRAAWVVPFARMKRDRLEGLLLGRDPRFQAAVRAYCSFLDALSDGAGTRRLQRLLDEANQLEAALTKTQGATRQQAEGRNLGKQSAKHENTSDTGRPNRP